MATEAVPATDEDRTSMGAAVMLGQGRSGKAGPERGEQHSRRNRCADAFLECHIGRPPWPVPPRFERRSLDQTPRRS